MAGFKIFLAVFVVSTAKDGVYSCSLRSHKTVPYPCSTPLSDSTSNLHHTKATKLHTTTLCHSAPGSDSGLSSISPNGLISTSKQTFAPDSFIPAPGTLLPNPGTLLPNPGTLFPPSGSLLPAPGTLLPAPGTLLPAPGKLLPAPGTLFPKPSTLFPPSGSLLPPSGSLLPAPGKLLPAPAKLLPAPGTLLPAPGTLLPAPGTLFPSPVQPPKPVEYSSNYLDLLNILNDILSSSPSNIGSSVPLQIPGLPVSPGITRGKIPKPYFPHAPLSAGSNPCSSGILPTLPLAIPPPLIAAPGLQFPILAPVVPDTSFTNVSGSVDSMSNVFPAGDGNSPKPIPLSELCSMCAPGFNESFVPPGLASDSSSSNATSVKVPEATIAETPPAREPQSTVPSPTATAVLTPADASSDSTAASNASTKVGNRNEADIDRLLDYILSSTAAPPAVPGAVVVPQSPPLVPVATYNVTKPHRKTCQFPFPIPTLPGIPMPAAGPMSGVSSGYNPAFMQLLLNRLLQSKPDLPAPLLSLPCFQPPSTNNPAAVTPSSQNPSISNPFDLNTGNISPSDNAPASTIATLNSTLCNNPEFTNTVCKLLLQPHPKTHPSLQTLPGLDLKSALFNATPPALNDLRDTLQSGLASAGASTSSPNPFSIGITSETVSEPANIAPSTPAALPRSGLNICRQKIARKHKLPCLHNIAHPVTTPAGP